MLSLLFATIVGGGHVVNLFTDMVNLKTMSLVITLWHATFASPSLDQLAIPLTYNDDGCHLCLFALPHVHWRRLVQQQHRFKLPRVEHHPMSL